MDADYCYTVCTRCFTFNHADYILDALNGFVAQQTDFPVVYTIVDDASTDNEQAILQNFFNENFDISDTAIAYRETADFGIVLFARHKINKNCFFAILLLKENHYSQKKSKLPYLDRWANKAKYTALCEGDDYWTDPQKLMKQVRFLEANEDCCMVACSALWINQEGVISHNTVSSEEKDLTTQEVILGGGGYLSTCSLIMRSCINKDIPRWRRIANVVDYPLQIHGALSGTLHFIPDCMCVYRSGHPGSWTERFLLSSDERTSQHRRDEIRWMVELDKATKHKYRKEIYTHLWPYIPILYRKRMVSTSVYARAVSVVGSYSDYKRMIKNIVKRVLRYNEPL